jgi:hypothetical protein
MHVEARPLASIRLGQLNGVAPAGWRTGHDGSFTARQITSATSSDRVDGPERCPVILSKTLRAKSEYASGTATPCFRI